MEEISEYIMATDGASRNRAVTAKISERDFQRLSRVLERSGRARSAFIRNVLSAVLDYLEETDCGESSNSEAVRKLLARLSLNC